MTQTLIKIYAFFLGACLGSFLNVCVVRWPRDLSIVKPRSRCPQCGYQLAWYDNIPIVSWVWLRARCRCCGEPISPLYPLVELFVALGWFAAASVFAPDYFTALRIAVFGTILLGVGLTDARSYLIPDGFTLTGFIWALATAVIAYLRGQPPAGAMGFDVASMFALNPYDAIVGACAGAGMIAIVGWLGEIATKRDAMGLGDVTLMAFVGATVGPGRALLTVFMGAILGVVCMLPLMLVRRRVVHEQTELQFGSIGIRSRIEFPLVPFGVFLAPAALITLLWGDALLQWWLRRGP